MSPNLKGEFIPKFGETPNFSAISETNMSPNMVNPQICPQIWGKFFSPNLVNPQICPQILGQIRPQICPQKAREHTS